jgi:hypothetical protein
MKRGLLVLPCLLLLYGCFLPVPVRIATWAIDGAVMLATRKSVTDHGISLLAGQDCSILRGMSENKFCLEAEPETTALAAVDVGPSVPAPDDETEAEALAAFVTAAGMAEPPPAPTPSTRPSPSGHLGSPIEPVSTGLLEEENLSAVSALPIAPAIVPKPASKPTGSGVYLVVGSFLNLANAERRAERHWEMDPTIVEAKLDGRTHYRVVVGPYPQGERDQAHRYLIQAGVYDSWAIVLNPSNWRVADVSGPGRREVAVSALPAN